jgi:hypothetical protein
MARAKTAGAGSDEVARPANEKRGEAMLVLDGAEMVMRPSFEAIEAFEALTGKGLLELAREALASKLRLSETAQIATECVRAWGRATGSKSMQGVNATRMAELILESEAGYVDVLKTVAGMLAMASTGQYTAVGELKAGTTATTTGTPAAS